MAGIQQVYGLGCPASVDGLLVTAGCHKPFSISAKVTRNHMEVPTLDLTGRRMMRDTWGGCEHQDRSTRRFLHPQPRPSSAWWVDGRSPHGGLAGGSPLASEVWPAAEKYD